MTAQTSRTLGAFNVPAGLPVAEFDLVNERVARRSSGNEDIWYGFASAWTGVAYRMRAALDYEQRFSASVANSTAPPPDERYRQDHDLFGFVVCAVSAIECFHVAAYCMGSLLKPEVFPLSKPTDFKFYPWDVRKDFASSFPGEALCEAMQAADGQFKQLWRIRNVLVHRAGTVPRTHYFSAGQADIPSAIPSNLADLATNWRYEFQLLPQCLQPYKQWLEKALHQLIKAAAVFASDRL